MFTLKTKIEGINYIGSKQKIIPYILDLIEQEIPDKKKIIFDAFSGSTRVSQALAQKNYKVIANDKAIWSKVFAQCYLQNLNDQFDYQSLIDHLNFIKPIDGWFTENYGGYVKEEGSSIQNDGLKKIWQIHNTRKLDAIRQEIQALALDEITESILLTSLLLALNKVDNTLGHYSSYLKKWSKRSYKILKLQLPLFFKLTEKHEVYCKEIFSLLPEISCDVAYFDPPYGSNNEMMPPSRVRYESYYHILKSIILFDKPPLFGKAKRRQDSSDKNNPSIFESFKKDSDNYFIALKAVEQIIQKVNCKWIILSYNVKGEETSKQLNKLISDAGEIIKIIEIDHKKNVMGNMKWTNKWISDIDKPNKELLFLIKKD